MEDIELVIKIPKEAYELLKNKGVDWLGAEHILNAVANGTPLPKGHGRLIDTNDLIYKANTCIETTDTFIELTKDARTIIEADKAESEDKE